jgi:hypothetical protein
VPTAKTTTKPKEQAEAGPSTKTSSPTANTRKAATHTQVLGSSATPKKPRRKEMVSREEVKGDAKNGETSWPEEEEAQDEEEWGTSLTGEENYSAGGGNARR